MSFSKDSSFPSSTTANTSSSSVPQPKLTTMSSSSSSSGVSKLSQSTVLKPKVGLVSNSSSGPLSQTVVNTQSVGSSGGQSQALSADGSNNQDSAGSTITLSASEVAEALNNNQISISNGRYISRVPISDDGMGHCIRCGSVGVKDTFYGKGKQFCSLNCVRGLPPQQPQAPLYKIVSLQLNKFTGNHSGLGDSANPTMVTVAMPICSSAPSTSTQSQVSGPKKQQPQSSGLQPQLQCSSGPTSLVNSMVTTSSASPSTLPQGRVIIRQQQQQTQPQSGLVQTKLVASNKSLAVSSRSLSSLQTTSSSGQLFQLNPSQASTALALSTVTVSSGSQLQPSLLSLNSSTSIAQLQSHIQQQKQQQLQQQQMLSQMESGKKRNYSKVSVGQNVSVSSPSTLAPGPSTPKRVKRNSQSSSVNVLAGKKIKVVKQSTSSVSQSIPDSGVVVVTAGTSTGGLASSPAMVISNVSQLINSQQHFADSQLQTTNSTDNRILINQLMRKPGLVGTLDPLAPGGVHIINAVNVSQAASSESSSSSSQLNQNQRTQPTAVALAPQQLQFLQQQLRTGSVPNSVNSRLAQMLQASYGPRLQQLAAAVTTSTTPEKPLTIYRTPQPPVVPSLTISQQIKSLDSAVLSALNTSSNSKQTKDQAPGSTANYPPVWSTIFDKYSADHCAPVDLFVNLPLFELWPELSSSQVCFEIKLTEANLMDHSVVDGHFSPGLSNNNNNNNNNKSNKKNRNHKTDDLAWVDSYWFVRVVSSAGYYLRVRYVGLEDDSSAGNEHDQWINLRLRNLYPVGYSKQNGFRYQAPALVTEQTGVDYRSIVRQFLQQAKSVNSDLYSQFCQQLHCQALTTGTRLEVLDRNRVSTMRVGTVDEVIGDRILVRYDQDPNSLFAISSGDESNGSSFWTHANAGFVRPVGWSQLVGHPLYASKQYSERALQAAVDKIRKRKSTSGNQINCLAVLTPTETFDHCSQFKRGMKLEVLNPSNYSSICVGTVQKLLRFNFLLISIDDVSDPNGYDWFCCHASSPLLLPAGFCAAAKIELSPPPGFTGQFNWPDYCALTQSDIAPLQYFSFRQAEHEFREGMLLEAVDLVEPHLICVAIIRQVAGRLLRLHFIGWEDHYDQWCDCYSPNIFPVGYCDLVEHPLQGPPNKNGLADKKRKSSTSFTRRKRKSNSASASKSTKSCPVVDHSVDIGDSGSSSSASKPQQSATSGHLTNGQLESHSLSSSIDSGQAGGVQLCQLDFQVDNSIVNPGPFLDQNPVHCKLSLNSVPISKHSQLCFKFETDILKHDQSSSTSYRLDQDCELVVDDGQEQENHNLLESGYLRSMPLFKRFSSKYYRKEVQLDLRADLRQLVSWTPWQVGKFLVNHNFDQFYDSVVMNKIDGAKLLMLTRAQAQKLGLFPKPSQELFNFVQKLRAQIAICAPDH